MVYTSVMSQIVPMGGAALTEKAPAETSRWTRRRWLFVASVPLLAFLLAIFVLVNVLIRPPSFFAPRRAHPDDGAIPFAARNSEGNTISAWYYPGKSGAGALVLCHGHGVDHQHFLSLRDMIYRLGLGLITFDFRAHGLSEGRITAIGGREVEDVKAVLLQARRLGFISGTTPLAAYGRSMGAATLANGSAELPEIKAFILESCFADLREIAGRDVTNISGIPDFWFVDLVMQIAEWYTGYPYTDNRPVDRITGIGKRPVLLIHDDRDRRALKIDYERLVAQVPHCEKLEVSNAGHVKAFETAPAVFETTIRRFLQEAGFDISRP